MLGSWDLTMLTSPPGFGSTSPICPSSSRWHASMAVIRTQAWPGITIATNLLPVPTYVARLS